MVAIVTNCALLVCLYDDAGRWKIEPGLAAILLLEHLLLLAKFGFSWFVPEVISTRASSLNHSLSFFGASYMLPRMLVLNKMRLHCMDCDRNLHGSKLAVSRRPSFKTMCLTGCLRCWRRTQKMKFCMIYKTQC